ncbi:MAG: transglycosylase domain-containing protein [Bacteroidota bacterium]
MAKSKKKGESMKKVFLRFTFYFWLIFGLGVFSVFVIFYGASNGWLGELPTFEQIENPESNFASEIYSSDGVVIGKYYDENRSPVKYDELSPYLVDALISTEDERFRDHSGIDFKSLARAVVMLGQGGGGSTITQQLAKMLFTGTASRSPIERVKQKIKEWVISIKLERQYTKDEIIMMYFNKFDFNYLAVGINSAAKIYFNTTPQDLKIEEAAMLVGMAKNPSLYNPRRREEITTQRRNTVFLQMERNGVLNETQVDSLSNLPIKLDFNPESHDQGIATYFREYLRDYLKKWIKEHPKADGTKYNLYRDGLKVYTTIDSRMQKYAEEAVNEHISNLQEVFFTLQKYNKTKPFEGISTEELDQIMNTAMRRSVRYRQMKKNGISEDSIKIAFNTPREMKVYSWKGDIDTTMTPMDSLRYYKFFLETGMMSMEPGTGFVKAWVGGIDYKYFKYDHVKQGKRQVGSTFKPFVYASTIDQLHYSPCYEIPNTMVTFEKEKFGLEKDWTPKNSGGDYGGMISLKKGLALSKNNVTAFLMKQIGPKPVAELVKEMGVTQNIPAVPSIALGTPDLSVYEMVGAYGSFANKGIYTKPTMVLRIEDNNGVVIDEFVPETKEVMSAETAYVMLNLMQGVTQYGTGVRLRTRGANYNLNSVTGYPYEFTNPIAGKTGTSQNHSDGWFMGIVPNLVTGVWVGNEDRSVHFKNLYYGQGATTALPIWGIYMKKVYADEDLEISKGAFEVPEGGVSINLDCNKTKEEASKEIDIEEEEF